MVTVHNVVVSIFHKYIHARPRKKEDGKRNYDELRIQSGSLLRQEGCSEPQTPRLQMQTFWRRHAWNLCLHIRRHHNRQYRHQHPQHIYSEQQASSSIIPFLFFFRGRGGKERRRKVTETLTYVVVGHGSKVGVVMVREWKPVHLA